jgi:hypothetical protein
MTIGAVGDRSTMGALLDRARLFAVHARPCTACGGDVARGVPGRGFVWGAGTGTDYERALRHEIAVAEFLGLDPERDLDPGLFGETCSQCDGRGWVVDERRSHDRPRPPPTEPGATLWARGAVRDLCTAHPTGSSQEPATSRDEVSDHETLALLGLVSRRLLAIGERHADVLRAYYLPTTVRESPRAVWPLTPAGRTLLRASAPGVGPWQAIEALLRAQAENPTANRRAQIDAANAQSERMIASAVAAWVALVERDAEERAAVLLGAR